MAKRNLRSALAIAIAAMVSISFIGCSSNPTASKTGDATSASTSSPKATAPMDIKVMFYTSSNIQFTHDNNEAIKFLENKFNIHLELMDVPISDYTTKQNVVLASGDLPDVMVWNSFPDAGLSNYLKQGAFMQLEKYIESQPNLMKFPKELWDNLKVDGHSYLVPRPRPIVRTGVVIRKDWLDKLNLPIPKTMDDLAKTAVAFAKDDPDGNGKADTYGIATGSNVENLNPIFYAFGAGNGWLKQADGTLINSSITPGTKQALQWLHDLYEQGALSKDFMVQKGMVRKELQAGKAGMMIESYIVDYAQDLSALKKVDPKAELVYIDAPVGPTGISAFNGTTGTAGGWVIPAKAKPEKVKKIMEIINWEASDEGYHFGKFGIDGIHNMKNADGTFTTNDKYKSDDLKELIMISPYDIYSYVDGSAPEPIQKIQRAALDMVKGKGLFNPVPAYIAPTSVQKDADLNKLKIEYQLKIVSGELPISAFDEFVTKWKAGGGDQITKETNDFYKAQGGK